MERVSMKFLVVGLGSMGKRRIRNLQHLGYKEISGFDLRHDRCDEVTDRYDVLTYNSFEECFSKKSFDALIISTPPKYHHYYAEKSVELGISCFIEASVLDQDKFTSLDKLARQKNVLVAPSCTMKFFPGPKLVKKLIHENSIGSVLYFNYHTGQFLEDWHPWESIHDFYVTDPETSACREIVPFELTWLNDIFGLPTPLTGIIGKVSNLDTPIDDIYQFTVQYPDRVIGNITIEILSRPTSSRELRIVGESGIIKFSADSNSVSQISLQTNSNWISEDLDQGSIETGYINPEQPYQEEISAFIQNLQNRESYLFPNTLLDDQKILDLLNKIENISIKL